ncbi:MAG: hypothetical protein GY832_17725 [Chloroflexi bacterium]|nr:hypothetical protein [Chloroflexota bacterium]
MSENKSSASVIFWMVVRAVFGFSIVGAAVTGSAAYAPFMLVTGIILFFVDGWPLLLLWPILAFLLFGCYALIF